MREFDVTEMRPALISANFSEVEADLTQMMTAYQGLEVTEDNVSERKADLATLRKIRKAIDDKRKAIKKDYNKPFEAFEKNCKKLTGIIDAEITRIDTGVKELDVRMIQAKQKLEHDIYDETIGEWSEYLPFEAVKRPQWDNKTYSEKDIVCDIQEAVLTVRTGISTIKAMRSEFEDELIRTYKDNGLNLALVMQRESQLRSAKQIAERKAAEDAQKASETVDRETHSPMPENASESHTEPRKWVIELFDADDYDEVITYMQLNCIKYEEV